MDQLDQRGSRDGKKGKMSRESLKGAFHIRITASKIVGAVDQWDQKDLELVEILKEKFPKGSINYECGGGGQHHFQIHVWTGKTRYRRLAVREYLIEHYDNLLFPEIDYCEPCTKQWASEQYCKKAKTQLNHWEWGTKEESRELTLADMPEPYKWQLRLIEKYREPAEVFNPFIDWYYDPKGQMGKTMMIRFLYLHHKFYLLDGGPQKMRHLAAKNPSEGYCYNIVRSQEERFSYQGLESISDQIYADTFGCEMEGMVCRRGVHVIVVSNFLPDVSALTKSRWRIYEYVDVLQDWHLVK